MLSRFAVLYLLFSGTSMSFASDDAKLATPFGKYLLCINSLTAPYANRFSFSGIDKSPSSENHSAIFYGKVMNKSGIIMVTPNLVTLDEVAKYKPEIPNVEEYRLMVVTSDGVEYRSQYFVSNGRGWGANFASANNNVSKDSNSGVSFYRLGKPTSKIPDAHAIGALAAEAIPAIESIPESPKQYEYANDRVKRGYNERFRKKAREAICNCLKTGHPAIAASATRVGAKLQLDDLEECADQFVSDAEQWFARLMPRV